MGNFSMKAVFSGNLECEECGFVMRRNEDATIQCCNDGCVEEGVKYELPTITLKLAKESILGE